MDKLVFNFGRGNIQAHQFLFRQHSTELYRYADELIRNRKEGIEIVHEAAIRIWYRDNTALHSLEDVKALYFITVKNTCTNYLRHMGNDKYQTYRARLNTFLRPSSLHVDLRFIENTSQQVIDKAREVLKLTFAKPMTADEVAKNLRISVGEVSHYSRVAMQSIQMILAENFNFFFNSNAVKVFTLVYNANP